MATQADTDDRLRVLVDAGIALNAEHSLDRLLQRVVETAARLTGARYAALGVIDEAGERLERFLTTGIDDATRAAIGDPPQGRGILGVLISDATPLRLHDLASDPRSVGFPPEHPPMRAFLGVPILLRGVAYGNLYLTEKEDGGDFTVEDEELTRLLAGQAAVAIENARLHETAARWLQRLETLNELGTALASELELAPMLGLVARRLRELVDARLVLIALPEGDTLRVVAAEGDVEAVGLTLGISSSKAGHVLRRGRSERVDSMQDDPAVDRDATRRLDVRTALFVPLRVRGRSIGVVIAHDKSGASPCFTDDDLRLAEMLSQRAAVAVDLSERVGRDVVRRVVEAQELERRSLARELHDETGQQLTSVLLGLKPLEDAVATDDGRAALAALREQVVETLKDVRRLAVELRPSALDDFGLTAALARLAETVADRAGITVDFESNVGDERLPGEVETVVYRIVQEALTNVVKHSGATAVSVLVTRRADAVAAVIDDDGNGFDPAVPGDGLGLVGMRERVALVGGRLDLESAAGRGTTVAIEVPLR